MRDCAGVCARGTADRAEETTTVIMMIMMMKTVLNNIFIYNIHRITIYTEMMAGCFNGH